MCWLLCYLPGGVLLAAGQCENTAVSDSLLFSVKTRACDVHQMFPSGKRLLIWYHRGPVAGSDGLLTAIDGGPGTELVS